MQVEFSLGSEHDTLALAADIASLLLGGDCVALEGDLGAGKSFFARAVVRYLSHDDTLEVPSPTYTLVQSYDTLRLRVHHADFYRLSSAEEVEELGLFDGLGDVQLIEWPSKAPEVLPKDHLHLELSITEASGRVARFTATSKSWQDRLQRLQIKRQFLAKANAAHTSRQPMQGDCSTRIYERLVTKGKPALILMDAPLKPDPGLTTGQSYSAIAHLAEDMRPFVAIGDALAARGFSAPAILQADVDTGFLLLEDLGTEGVLSAEHRPEGSKYHAAVACLAQLHKLDWSQPLPVRGGVDYTLPPYDMQAMMAEVALLPQWYAPHMGHELSAEAQADFGAIWQSLAQDLQELPQTLVLRDYHSPNILWLEEREGLRKVGIIDFQDGLLGPEAYDVASVCQDARVFVPLTLEKQLLNAYMEARHEDKGFDPFAFHKSYRVMGAQRATKVLGIFARLAKRDNKPQHLDKLPIVRGYLARNLEHAALTDLAQWHQQHLPLDAG